MFRVANVALFMHENHLGTSAQRAEIIRKAKAMSINGMLRNDCAEELFPDNHYVKAFLYCLINNRRHQAYVAGDPFKKNKEKLDMMILLIALLGGLPESFYSFFYEKEERLPDYDTKLATMKILMQGMGITFRWVDEVKEESAQQTG